MHKAPYEKMSDGREVCIADEVPFDVPDGWAWCRLGEIGTTNIGLTYHPVDLKNNGIPVLRSNNIQNNKLDLNDLARVTTRILDNQFVNEGDVLICAINGSKGLVGKCTLIEKLPEKCAFGAFMAVFRSQFNQYILKVLQSNYFKDYLEDSNSTQIYQVTQNMLKNFLIPLPPLAEQATAKNTIHNRPYTNISDDEKPFEIPNSWAWCRITEIAKTELGKTLDVNKNKGELYNYLCALNVKWYSFDFTTLKQIRLEEGGKGRYLVKKR